MEEIDFNIIYVYHVYTLSTLYLNAYSEETHKRTLFKSLRSQ